MINIIYLSCLSVGSGEQPTVSIEVTLLVSASHRAPRYSRSPVSKYDQGREKTYINILLFVIIYYFGHCKVLSKYRDIYIMLSPRAMGIYSSSLR